MGSLLGGSKSTSSSSNRAFDAIKGIYTPAAEQGVGAQNFIAQLLGLQGDAGANQAFQNYLNSSGYKFQLGEGMKAITSNNAARGLLNSGATLKKVQEYGQNLASTGFNNYLGQLGSVVQSGLGAGGLITSAGQTSSSNSKESGGIGGLIGGVLGAFSDRRIKTDIRALDTDADGIKWYGFRYKPDAREELGIEDNEYIGVLAQDLVGTRFEEAVFADEDSGYFKVDYEKLSELSGAA